MLVLSLGCFFFNKQLDFLFIKVIEEVFFVFVFLNKTMVIHLMYPE